MTQERDQVLSIVFVDLARRTWGAENSLLLLVDALTAQGHSCTLVAWSEDLAQEWAGRSLGPVVRIAGPDRHRRFVDLMSLWKARHDVPTADAVVIFSLDLLPAAVAFRAARRFRDAVVAFDLHDNLGGLNGRTLLRLFSRATDVVIAVSDFTAAQVPSGRAVMLYRPGSAPAPAFAAGLPDEPLIVGIVGRVDRAKGHMVAVQALGLTERPVRLVIRGASAFGDVGYTDELVSQVRDTGVDVRLEGRVAADRAMAGLHAVLVTNADEPMGRTVVEGQLHGLAVVVPDRGGASELVEHAVTGWQYRAGDPGSLAAVLDEVASRSDVRARVGEHARAVAIERHDPVGYAHGYARALATRRARRGGRRPAAPPAAHRADRYTILHVVNDTDTGGAQTLIGLLAAHRCPWQALRLVVLGSPGQLSRRLEADFDSVDYLNFDRHSWAVHRLVREVGRKIRAYQPDVVHSHLLHADLAVAMQRLGRTATVSTVHTTGMSDEDPRRSRVLGRVMGVAARRFGAVVACDPTSASWARRMGYPAATMEVIRNGVIVENAVDREDPGPRLVSLARWHPMKDHRTLFRAVRRLADQGLDVRLRCAGSGMDASNPELAGLVAEAGVSDHVELLGARDGVSALLGDARALVISSAYGEAMPMAGLEALAQGRPVVTTDVGGCPQLAVDPSLVVATQDPRLLAHALERVLTAEYGRWVELCDAAQALARTTFDVTTTVQSYDAVYRRLIESKDGRSAMMA